MRFFIILLVLCLCNPVGSHLQAGQSAPVVLQTVHQQLSVSPVEPLPKKPRKPFWKRPFNKKQKGEELARGSYWFMISWLLLLAVLIFMLGILRFTVDPIGAWYWMALAIMSLLSVVVLFMYMIGLVLAVSYTVKGWLLKNRFILGYISVGVLAVYFLNYALAFALEYPDALIWALYAIALLLWVIAALPILIFNIKDQASLPFEIEEQEQPK